MMKEYDKLAQKKLVTNLLRKSILELCKASIPQVDGTEIDGIVVISLGRQTDEQIIVQIHETISSNVKLDSFGQPANHAGNNNQYDADTTLQEAEVKRQNKRKSSCPLPLSKKKITCTEIEPEFGYPLEEVPSADENGIPEVNIMDSYVTEDGVLDFSSNSSKPKPICIEPSGMHVCEGCKQSFSEYGLYLNHIEKTQHCKINSCQFCNRHFTNFNSFVIHMRVHGAQEINNDFWKGKPLRCGVCTTILRSKRGVIDHMKNGHHLVKCYTCSSCEEIYPDFNTFKAHRQSNHSNINQCRCEMCDLFFTFTEFKDHEKECMIKIHTTIGQSSYVFLNTSSVVDGQSRDSSSDNVMVVDESKPEVSMVVQHSPKVEQVDLVKTPKEQGKTKIPPDGMMQGPFRCQSCFSVFLEFEQYETHNHEMHSRFVCSYCAQSFASRRNLHRHARRHTGIRPYPCLDCNMTFTREDDRKKHRLKMNHLTGYTPKGSTPDKGRLEITITSPSKQPGSPAFRPTPLPKVPPLKIKLEKINDTSNTSFDVSEANSDNSCGESSRLSIDMEESRGGDSQISVSSTQYFSAIGVKDKEKVDEDTQDSCDESPKKLIINENDSV